MGRTRQDAREWVAKAISFVLTAGKRIALAEFMNPKGMFVQDDMYLFVLNSEGVMLAHGVNERFVGENFSDLKDQDGKSFIREILDTANTKGSGWVDYNWFHPITKQVLPKTAYFDKVDDMDMIICSGVYKTE